MRLLLPLLLLLSQAAVAQSVSGTVRDAESGTPLAGVKVTDLSTSGMAISDAEGRFTIAGASGDPVSFSAAGYATSTRKVPTALGSVPWRVDLRLFNVSLNEVLIRPHLSGYAADSAERRAVYKRALARHRSSPIMSPVSYLAEHISRRQRALFKFQKDFVRMENEKFIDSRYTPDLAAQLTGLEGDTLAQFIRENPMPLDYARAATDLELKMWIRSQYKAWALRHPALAVTPPRLAPRADTTARKP